MFRFLCICLFTIHLSAGETNAQDQFWNALQARCGQSFKGEIALNKSTHQLAGTLEIKVHKCSPKRIEIPFAIGDDRSRTWILTRTQTGLRLKHEHRMPDGSLDKVTDYGGDTKDPGQANRQSFVVDAYTRDLVQGTDQNIWVFEIKDGTLAYELYKGDASPVFRAEFAL
ncbi:hypothetical protein [Acanthopleuribacter pedis]|uniref:Secreted protein n=1 Tax=Acanthopleuribacter pedis TaxID=442870 RepID=A0A8J7QES2_9BACT|nr:hypothetical protein [Acanthopleuribacter pedis]MBO1323322.1 hypothetical protein [Acanthopleuribacter pedis]